MEKTVSTAIERWRAYFETEPLSALDDLLFERVNMGRLNRNDPSAILFRLFSGKEEKILRKLDGAMQEWLWKYWNTVPPGVSPARWANILQKAFLGIHRLNLEGSSCWLLESLAAGRTWLRSLYISPARDPEATLLRVLAQRQGDQRLLPVWMRLCSLEEALPLHHASIGLLGLRKLPEKDGQPPGDLPEAVFKGLVSLAEAIDRQFRGGQKKEGRQFWTLECRTIMELYPRSITYWLDHFGPFLERKPESITGRWLSALIPDFNKKMEDRRFHKDGRYVMLAPVPMYELKKMLALIKNQPLPEIRSRLEDFLERHRVYARQTGDAEYLVKTFSNIGNLILPRAPELSLKLLEEALDWDPYHLFAWNNLAKVERQRGNYARAAELLWTARRRFPEDPVVRNGLAHILKECLEYETAEIIYRQTIVDFPGDVVCRTGLAGVLLQQGREEEAIAVLKETVNKFPHNSLARLFLEKIQKGEEIPEDLVQYRLSPQVSLVSAPTPEPYSGKEETEKETIKGAEEDVCQPAVAAEFQKPAYDNRQWESEIGLIYLYRQASRGVEGEVSRKYRENALSRLRRLLEQSPGNIPALLEKGWLLADMESAETGQAGSNGAEAFFKDRLNQYHNVAGFHLGYLRARYLKRERTEAAEWNDLAEAFSSRATVIRLEHAMQEMMLGNGSRPEVMEILRKQLKRNVKTLPPSLQKNEQWVIDTVKQSLFKEIDVTKTLTEGDLERIAANHAESEVRLKGVVEQCLGTL
jgi:tetratricopeptide (TPR) repeat protein